MLGWVATEQKAVRLQGTWPSARFSRSADAPRAVWSGKSCGLDNHLSPPHRLHLPPSARYSLEPAPVHIAGKVKRPSTSLRERPLDLAPAHIAGKV